MEQHKRNPAGTESLSSKLQRGELLSADCPSRGVLMHVTSRWGTLVLLVLQQGTHRFGELRRKVGGVSEKMLAQTLQALEGDGFIERKSLAVLPPHVEYSLTALGRGAAVWVAGLGDWIEVNLPRILAARRRRTDRPARQAPAR